MTVDDIYNAAIAGDTVQLRQLLNDGGSALLSEIIVSEDNGIVSKFTVLFSILAETQQAVNYEVLDILAEYGASFAQTVELDQDGWKKSRPLLEFAVSVWENVELTEYMLQKDANVNAVNSQTAHGITNKTTMIWYALKAQKSGQLLEVLLNHGADPEKCCEVYVEDLRTYQYLPPLYYSLVENGDYQNTVRLMRYGASPQCGIDVGVGFMHNTNFKNYISLNHPNLSSLLVQAFNAAQNAPAPNVVRNTSPTQQAECDRQTYHLNAGSRVTSMKRCYGKFTAFFFANFALWALGFCIIGPIVAASQNLEGSGVLLIVGIPCLLIAAAIFNSVKRKAAKRGQDGVMGQFVADSVLIFVKVLFMMTIVLIPLVKLMGSNIEWENRKTKDGLSVTVRKTGDGTYEDVTGQTYHTKDY